ncbi:uncharacterized protein LOC130945464 [Arachis stenosperma]|uniref:uncharacterized protein LOC130945464 n=1 Tax=Arachis stenosperma TaxID=217475 RepID=UPI0025AC556A|nr:uncharacterized protein LOC130945464 [Arachis stenosperma]
MDERKGASTLIAAAKDFRSWIQDMELVDLELNDCKFTSFKGQSCSRIDRVLVSVEWVEEFPKTRLKELPRYSNVTWVVLAPKFVEAREIKDLWPISIVGCVYKVISNVLVRRMHRVMSGLVGETQSDFVNGRKIHDETLITCETIKWLKTSKKRLAIIKLDFQKAYDRVKWTFMDIVLQKMGMVREAVRNGKIAPLLVSKNNIELSHAICRRHHTILPTKKETVRNYKRLLRCFEMMSDLSINFYKASFIPVNCEHELVQRMCRVLGCKEASLPVKYLGISLGANMRLVKTWKPIIDKVKEKFSLWKAKMLNKNGKFIFIRSILNSLPIYYFNLYKMPRAVVEKLISLQRRFLWSGEDGKHGWWWPFSKKNGSLWKKIVCPCNDMNPNIPFSSKPVPKRGGPWRNICQLQIKDQQVRDKMVKGLSLEIEDGRRI